MASNPAIEYHALPSWGYQVSRLRVSADTLATILDEAKARIYVPVFKQVGGRDEDTERLQSRLPIKTDKFSDAMKLLHLELEYVVRSHDQKYVPTVYSFMKSEADSVEQDPHKDYTPEQVAKVTKKHPATIPCSMIIAVETGTRLKVFDSCYTTAIPSRSVVVDLQPGACLLFRGDLIHCGMSYKQVNNRLHCYVTISGIEFVPDIVAGVNEKEYVCQYCGFLEVSSGAICQHRFNCARNPAAANRIRVLNNRPKERPRKCLRCGKTFSAAGYRKHSKKQPPCLPVTITL